MDEIKSLILQGLVSVNEKVDEHYKALDQDVKRIGDRLQDVEQKSATVRRDPGLVQPQGSSRVEAIKSAMNTDGFRTFRGGAMTSGPMSLGLELKALTSLQGSPETPQVGYDVQPDNIGVQTQVMRPLSILSVLQTRATTSNTIGYNRISFAGSAMAGYQEGEGTEKTEAELASAWNEAPVQTIAVHTTLSKQVLDDEPQLAQAVENLLRYGLANKVDAELMNGDGAQFHIEGLLTQATAATATATAAADRIGQVSSAMQATGYSPSVVFVNPADWFTISSERAEGDGHYVAGGWNAPASPNIYGLRVVPSAVVPIGEALVMDPAVAMVAVRQQPTVEMTREHNGNFTKNLVTILAETRLGLVVTDPAGLRSVSLTA